MTYTAEDLTPIPQLEEVGVPLLRKVWEQIKQDERAWKQESWVSGGYVDDLDPAVIDYIIEHQVPPWNCGTAYCIAGHVALAKGWKLSTEAVRTVRNYAEFEVGTLVKGERYLCVPDIAKTYLPGIAASAIFDGDNTAEEIEAMIVALETYGTNISLWDVLTAHQDGKTWTPEYDGFL